jgi:hypothetical protein
MKNYKNSIQNYFGSMADENHYIGGYNGVNSFVGEDMYVGENMQTGISTASLPRIPDAAQTLTFVISNTDTTSPLTATLFGGAVYPTLTQPTGVTVSVTESSHNQVRLESVASPFYIQGFRYFVNTGSTSQFSNIWAFKNKSIGGMDVNKTLSPLNYFTANQNQSAVIEDLQYSFSITGNDYIEIIINAATTVSIVMFIKSQVRNDNFLQNRPAVDVARGSSVSKYSGTPLIIKGA